VAAGRCWNCRVADRLDAFETTGSSPPIYLTTRQVAELLQVDPTTVFRWASTEPTMPATRIGGTVRFHRERLLRWLDAREQGRRRAS
jgi:excisionase family DNA binding protein